jgi:hypothetical protein
MANPETGNRQKPQSHERFSGPIVPERLTPRRWCPNPGDDDDDDHNNSRWLRLSLKLKIAQQIDFPLSYYYSVHNNNTHKEGPKFPITENPSSRRILHKLSTRKKKTPQPIRYPLPPKQ